MINRSSTCLIKFHLITLMMMYIHFSRRDLYANLMKNIPKLTCTYSTEDEPAMKMSGAILYDLTSEPHTIKVNDKIPDN